MHKNGLAKRRLNRSLSFSDKVLWVIVIIVIFLIVIFLVRNASQKPNDSITATQTSSSQASNQSTASNSFAVLSPATVPSKTAECSQAVTFAGNGSSSPITCANGDLNATEWNSLSSLEPKVMTLGYGASAAQVQSTLCSDVANNISNIIEQENYQISSLYYGWNFSSNPSAVLTNGTCQNIDD